MKAITAALERVRAARKLQHAGLVLLAYLVAPLGVAAFLGLWFKLLYVFFLFGWSIV